MKGLTDKHIKMRSIELLLIFITLLLIILYSIHSTQLYNLIEVLLAAWFAYSIKCQDLSEMC